MAKKRGAGRPITNRVGRPKKQNHRHFTFLLDMDVKDNFKEACLNNGTNMSVVLGIMMESYINATKERFDEKAS